jgi:peptidoglycan hydrolase-like protein with peptidoglycan-binding domain
MKPSVTATTALAVLAALATPPALAQQAATATVRPTWQSPGEPLAAAQTTRTYVPNRDVISAVQQRLSQLGYPAQVNGNYDANLRNNVLRFQSETGLRPTGEVDLSTIGALGINVEPVGTAPATTAMAAPAPVAQEARVRRQGYDQILERDEYMNSPQTRHQATPLENTLGVIVPNRDIQLGEVPPGLPPDYPPENLGLD